VIDIKSDAIRELVAPVVAFLRHDIARPQSSVHMDKGWAEQQLSKVLELVNDQPLSSVEQDTEQLSAREIRELLQENLQRRD
jgi:hypothetical protein